MIIFSSEREPQRWTAALIIINLEEAIMSTYEIIATAIAIATLIVDVMELLIKVIRRNKQK